MPIVCVFVLFSDRLTYIKDILILWSDLPASQFRKKKKCTDFIHIEDVYGEGMDDTLFFFFFL